MNARDFTAWLIANKACYPAIGWALGKTSSQAWEECHRGDWLLWWAHKQKQEIRSLTLTQARCAKLAIPFMFDRRSINAVNVAEQFGLGMADENELRVAATSAEDATVEAIGNSRLVFHAAMAATMATSIGRSGWRVPTCVSGAADASQFTDSNAFSQTLLKCAEIVRETIKPNWI